MAPYLSDVSPRVTTNDLGAWLSTDPSTCRSRPRRSRQVAPAHLSCAASVREIDRICRAPHARLWSPSTSLWNQARYAQKPAGPTLRTSRTTRSTCEVREVRPASPAVAVGAVQTTRSLAVRTPALPCAQSGPLREGTRGGPHAPKQPAREPTRSPGLVAPA